MDVEKIVTGYARDSDGIVVVYRHYFYWIASLFLSLFFYQFLFTVR